MKRIQALLRWRTPEWVTSALLGGFTIGVFTLQGLASGVYVEMYRDFGVDDLWPQRIHKFIHWQWTLPVSIMLAIALVLKAKAASPRCNRLIDLVVCLAVFALVAGWIWSAFCIRIRT